MATAEALRQNVSWRRALTPVFVYKRYPGGYHQLLDAICQIAGFFPTATLGVESLTERTGLSRRYVERVRNRLVKEGVLQLVEQSTGGRISGEVRAGAPGRANVYRVGPAVQSLPLKLPGRASYEPRSVDRGFRPKEPRSVGRGSTPKEPRSVDLPTHALSGEVRVFKTRLESREGMGEGGKGRGARYGAVARLRPPRPGEPGPIAYCTYCDTHAGRHEEGCPRPRGKSDV